MAEVTNELTGLLLSISVIVIFGEIIPQALGARYGLVISAYSLFVLYFFVALLIVLTYPIAAILDKILG